MNGAIKCSLSFTHTENEYPFFRSGLISCVFMQMSANDSSPLYLLNDNYLGNVETNK